MFWQGHPLTDHEVITADTDDRLVTDTHVFKVGSQYTDLTGKKFYIRVDTKKVVADWAEIGAGA